MSARFNQILVIDSLPDGERGLIDRLFDDMQFWAQVFGQAPAIVRRSLTSASDLPELLDECADVARREPYVPMLHLECHGHGTGLEFSDGSILHWTDLKPHLVALNVATKLNLVLIVAACFGGDIARISGADDRAPFWGFVAPKAEISAGLLSDAMSAFYQTLLRTKSAQLAMEALRGSQAGSQFWNLSAATIFKLIDEEHARDYLADENVARRAIVMRALAAQQGVEWPLQDVEQMIRDPQYLTRMRDRFFMVDLFPDNRERFALA
jgi:hypothetical protein